MEEALAQNKAEVIAGGFLSLRKSLWMDSRFWRVINYRTSGNDVFVQIVPSDDLRKKKRHVIELNRDEFIRVADKHFNTLPYVGFIGVDHEPR